MPRPWVEETIWPVVRLRSRAKTATTGWPSVRYFQLVPPLSLQKTPMSVPTRIWSPVAVGRSATAFVGVSGRSPVMFVQVGEAESPFTVLKTWPGGGRACPS